MQLTSDYLKLIDEVIAKGPYKDDWKSLSKIGVPQWYKNGKFGIFIHWGVNSVPAFENEWYARTMHMKGHETYEHHLKTYGHPKDFPYEKFIPMFKAEKFDPKVWVKLFVEAGAKFVMPVSEHHDGFQMYNSELSNYNSVKMGPKRDIIGELKKEIESAGLIFSTSSHRAENYWFMNSVRYLEGMEVAEFQEPYGYACAYPGKEGVLEFPEFDEEEGPNEDHMENWLARTCEIVDRYQPQILWFDWWIHNYKFKPYLKKFAAYYYNRGLEWGKEVAINYKDDAFAKGTAIYDIERGQLSDIRQDFWQTDTSVSKNSWGYTSGNIFKTPESIVCDLVDIVSKNGALLLNIGPKSDGTITQEETDVLLGIGEWLKVNGESIYNTECWKCYGEGPTKISEGNHSEADVPYTSNDIRFTYNAPYLYATVLKWPKDGRITIQSLAMDKKKFTGKILSVDVLGYDYDTSYNRNDKELEIVVDGSIESGYPVCMKMKID